MKKSKLIKFLLPIVLLLNVFSACNNNDRVEPNVGKDNTQIVYETISTNFECDIVDNSTRGFAMSAVYDKKGTKAPSVNWALSKKLKAVVVLAYNRSLGEIDILEYPVTVSEGAEGNGILSFSGDLKIRKNVTNPAISMYVMNEDTNYKVAGNGKLSFRDLNPSTLYPLNLGDEIATKNKYNIIYASMSDGSINGYKTSKDSGGYGVVACKDSNGQDVKALGESTRSVKVKLKLKPLGTFITFDVSNKSLKPQSGSQKLKDPTSVTISSEGLGFGLDLDYVNVFGAFSPAYAKVTVTEKSKTFSLSKEGVAANYNGYIEEVGKSGIIYGVFLMLDNYRDWQAPPQINFTFDSHSKISKTFTSMDGLGKFMGKYWSVNNKLDGAFIAGELAEPDWFVTKWNTKNSNSIKFFLQGATGSNATGGHKTKIQYKKVGSSEWTDLGAFEGQGEKAISALDQNTEYLVRVSKPDQFKLTGSETDKDKLIDVVQWGTGTFTSMDNMFNSASSLTNVTASDLPIFQDGINAQFAFVNCENLVSINRLNDWDMSKFRTLESMFAGCVKFAPTDLGKWDTSKWTLINSMFSGCSEFNPTGLNNWRFPNLKSANSTFMNCKKFNQSLSNWRFPKLNTAISMLLGAKSFNQDLGNWTFPKLTRPDQMIDYTALSLENINKTFAAWAQPDREYYDDQFDHDKDGRLSSSAFTLFGYDKYGNLANNPNVKAFAKRMHWWIYATENPGRSLYENEKLGGTASIRPTP